MSVASPAATTLHPRHEAAAQPRVRTRAVRLLVRMLSYLLLLVVAMGALVMVAIPLASGSQTYTVLTSSMAPKYAPGTFLVVRPTPFNELRVGDVITYQIESGKPAVISHRIVSVGASQSGERVLTTQGDNNSLQDAVPVQAVQVRGKLFYAVPHVGWIANAIGQQRQTLLPVVGTGLVALGAIGMVRGAVERKQAGRGLRNKQ